MYAFFCKLGVLLVGVLAIRALLLGVHSRAPDFWKLPHKLQLMLWIVGPYQGGRRVLFRDCIMV